ncbi:ATP-grasp domain-containing protein [Streptomyces lavenduligriseus]|uniref:ATP-grasp domain-containing protein n=1 Tax=Streptomyces lavenduligriseus TaxID=67315 RepID=A0ABT0NTA9_9ACTN|nr:ATP-grasp domain-containing protein [Streptomyces lavenduligriseus]MCL3994426.1 ATP-grasp domain-containing protein [Streptomyces lavenduligriseus]
MAHLLMVESWVGSMSRLLPRAIREEGHEFTFLTRDLHHYLRSAPEGTAHPLLAARHVLTADTNDVEALLPFVQRAHDCLRFDGVITSCDYYLPAAARIAGRLGLPGPDPEAVENACRKDATRRILAEAGVPGPRFAVCGDWPETAAAARELGYPLVLKPVDLCAGMFVRRVDDEPALAHAYRALAGFPVNARGQRRSPAVLLEELLEGPEVSVETVAHGGTAHVVGVTDKSVGGSPAFIETGHMFPAALSPADTEAAERTALDALKALGLDTVVAHTEIKLTPGGPRVVEVNPRPAGNRITELIRHVTGIDLAAAGVAVALGRAPDLRRADTGLRSAAIAFLVPDGDGVLEAVDGAEEVRAAAGVLEVRLPEPGTAVRAAASNNEYLGHIMAGDADGLGARDRVEALLSGLRPRVVGR